jgi:hypothetical protein
LRVSWSQRAGGKERVKKALKKAVREAVRG